MLKENLEHIISKYISNEASESEIEDFLIWLEIPKNLKLFNDYVSINHFLNIEFKKFDSVKAYRNSLHINDTLKRKSVKSSYIKYVVAATIALLISLPFIFKSSNKTINNNRIVSDQVVGPGKDKAILTLEDGSQVVLEKGNEYQANNVSSNGKNIIYNSDKVKPAKEIVYNYLTIPRGGQFFMHLSDGTKVWLNSESKIKYPKAFIEGQDRIVDLIYGEAYFDVSLSTNHGGASFKVNSRSQNIEVLGTEFNIKAYNDDTSILTTLVEGKVQVNKGATNKLLRPGQQSIVSIENESLIKVREVNVTQIVAWKKGLLSFNEQPLKEIMKTLSRWYNVTVVFEDTTKQNLIFSVFLNRHKNIDKILEKMELTGGVSFTIKEKTIIIK